MMRYGGKDTAWKSLTCIICAQLSYGATTIGLVQAILALT